MKKFLVICMALMGVLGFTGYSDTPQDADPLAVTGFGGYRVGIRLNPKILTEQRLKDGYVLCEAGKIFRNFDKIRLYFTPKTFVVYQIYSSEKGNEDELEIIKASLEKRYKVTMKARWKSYHFSRNNMTVIAGHSTAFPDDINWISVTNDKLEEQYEKEKEEIVQSKVDTSGL